MFRDLFPAGGTDPGQIFGRLSVRVLKRIHVLAGLLLLTACDGVLLGPTIPFFGAYFPSWIACSLIGIIGSVIVRLIFIATGIDEKMPLRPLVYLSLAIGIGLASSLLLFGR